MISTIPSYLYNPLVKEINVGYIVKYKLHEYIVTGIDYEYGGSHKVVYMVKTSCGNWPFTRVRAISGDEICNCTLVKRSRGDKDT